MPTKPTTKPTVADVNALVTEALTWSHPWTVDSVRVVIDEATDAIAVPYLSHVKRVDT